MVALVYEFGPFRFEPKENRLLRGGSPICLPPQGFEMLLALVERSGSLVTKGELIERVWQRRFVEENSLNKCVSEVRKALGDQRVAPRYIETVAKRGYRFVAKVSRPAPGDQDGRTDRRRRSPDVHAYRLYREARCHILRYTSASWLKGLACYDQAIAQDPSYTLAHADLAIALTLGSVYYTSSEDVRQRARDAAGQALAIDPGLAEAHLAAAMVRYLIDWDWEGAEASFHKALDLDPEQSWTHDYYGFFLMLMGRFREALPALERAVELNPVRITVNGDLGLYHHFTGAVDGAIDHHRRALDLNPFSGLTRVDFARALESAGRHGEAIQEIQRTLPLDDAPWVRVWLARAYALDGQRDEAFRVLRNLRPARPARSERTAHGEGVSPVFPALVHAALGERKEAMELLREASDRRSPWMAFLRVEPGFESLRGEPGFEALQRNAGLPG